MTEHGDFYGPCGEPREPEQPPVKVMKLACPGCGSTENLGTIEKVPATARVQAIYKDPDHGAPFDIQWEGTTDYGDGESVGIMCRSCDWEYEAPNFLDQLVPENDAPICGEVCSLFPKERCHLPTHHLGQHEFTTDEAIVRWQPR